MKAYTLAIALAFITSGGSGHQQVQSTVSAKQPPSAPDYRLKYKSWSGTSPGADFIHTSLNFVDLDLQHSKIRRIWKSARRPDPMLPQDDATIEKLIAQVPWVKLTPEQVSGFRDSIRAWIETNSPTKYNSPMGLGREDGHVTSLTISWGTNTITTTLNPRGGYRNDGLLNPPVEWRALIESLIVTRKVPDGTLLPRTE
jgi:hypothetical protein